MEEDRVEIKEICFGHLLRIQAIIFGLGYRSVRCVVFEKIEFELGSWKAPKAPQGHFSWERGESTPPPSLVTEHHLWRP